MNMFGTKRYIALAAILLVLSGAAWGQTWDAGGLPDTSWSNANNWNPDVVPLPGQNATINMDATITVTGDQSITNVTVGLGRTVTISIDPTRSLTISGLLTNNGNLTITGGGSLAAASTQNNDTLTTSGAGTRNLGATTNAGTVVVDTSTLTATSITSTGTVSVNTGTINASGTISALTVTAGPANLNGTGLGLTVGGNPGGALATSGTVNLQGNTFTSITNTGTLTLSAATATLSGNMTLTAGTATVNALTVNGDVTGAGTFNGQAGAIDIDGNVTVANFRASSTTTTVDGNFQPTTMFNAYGGTMVFDTTANSAITTTVGAYNNVSLSAAKRPTAGTLTINGTLGLTAAGVLDLATNNAALSVAGPTTNGGTITGGSGALTFGNDATDQVTNTGVITAGSTDVIFRGNYVGGGGTLNGNIGADPSIRFRGATTTMGTVNINGDTVLFDGTIAQAFNPGAGNTYVAVTVDKTGGTFAANGNPLSCATMTLTASAGCTFNTDLTAGTVTNAGGGFDINFYGAATSVTSATFGTAGTVRLGNGGDTLTFDGGFAHTTGPTALAGNLVTTNDAVVFYDGVTARTLTINANSTITTGAAGNNITAHTIARGGATTWTLGLTSGTGNISITGAVGAGNALGALSMTSSGTIQANSTIDAASVGITGGAVDLNGNVTAPGGFSSSGTTFDNTGATITTTGTDIVIDHTTAVTIGAALTSGAGDIDIDTAGLTTVTDAGDITTTTGNVTFGASGTGALSTAGEITTGGGNIVFTRDTTITSAVTITTGAGAGNISFMAVLDGVAGNTDTLSLTAGTGSVTFSDTVGNGEPLGSLTVTSAGAGITANNTINSQTVNLTGGPVDLNNTVTAPGGFTSAGTTFDNTGATITTTGTNIVINHAGAITVGAALASGAGNIDIDSTGSTVGIGATVTTSTGAITIDADGLTTVTALVSATGNGSVAFAGTLAGALSLGADVTTVGGLAGGNISFGRPVTLAADVAVSTGPGTGNITFGANASITGAQTLTLTAGTGNVELASTAGTITSLTVTGANATFRNNITTSGVDGVDVTATTITLDGLTIDTTAGAGADIDLAGAVTLSTDPVILNADDNITINGTVNGAYNLTVSSDTPAATIRFMNTVGAGTPVGTGLVATNAITINGDMACRFDNTVAVRSGIYQAGNGTVTFYNNVTQAAGTAPTDTVFNGNVTFTNASALTFSSNRNITFGDTLADGVTINGGDSVLIRTTAAANGNITFNAPATSTQSLTIESIGYFISAEDADITLTGATFTKTGTGVSKLSGGITTNGAGNITFNTVLFPSAVYLLGSTGGSMTLSRGSPDNVITVNGDLFVGETDAPVKTFTFGSAIHSTNCVIMHGTIQLAATSPGVQTLQTTQDLVLLGSGYNVDDAVTGVPSLFAYVNGGRAGATSVTNTAIPTTAPGDPAISQTFSAEIAASLGGREITVGDNFYANGINLNPGSAWTLNMPDNDDALASFAEVYNLTIGYCNVQAIPPAGFARLAAAQATDVPLTNTNCSFGRPTILVNVGGQPTGGALSGTYTVYDDVIRVEFVDSLSGDACVLENDNNEIWNAVASIQYYAHDGLRSFSGSYIDPLCAATDATTGEGDITTGVIYLRANTGDPAYRWNTDATGWLPGAADSTDRGRSAPVQAPATRNSIPYIDLPSALVGVYQTIRDGNKNRVANTSVNTPNPGVTFTATADRCRPALVEVRTGQEQHDSNLAAQNHYDAHNFIELRYSEPVDIGGFNPALETAGWPAPYAQAQSTFGAGDWGGAITGADPINIEGYATIATGQVDTWRRGTLAADAPAPDDTVHTLYRRFFLNGGIGVPPAQPHRLRISIAGWCEAMSPGWFYQGFIQNATLPSGEVTVLPNQYITDVAGNILEPTVYDALIEGPMGTTGYGNFTNPAVAKAAVTVNNGTADLYGLWDTTRPVFAGVKTPLAWNGNPATHEAIPQASLSGNVNRLEMHFFDNRVAYDNTDQYQWRSRQGWYTPTSAPVQAVPETFGGSRPADGTPTLPTSGGVRDSSFVRANEGAFTVINGADIASNATELPGFLTRVTSAFFNPSALIDVADDPYQTIQINELSFTWPIASANLTVSYSAYSLATPSGGFVTDLAGNLLSTVGPLTCLDRAPPQVILTLAGVNRNDVLVLFSKNIDDGNDDPTHIRMRLVDGAGTDDVEPTAITFDPLSPRVLRFTLPDAISAERILNAGSEIFFLTGNPVVNPETGLPENSTWYSDIAGNYVPVGETHRLTDLGIGILDVLFASDGVNADGVFGAGEGALRVFDGSGNLLDRNVTVGTRLTSGMASPLPLTMYFDANPGAATAPSLFNSAANATSRLWLPSVLPGFNAMGNGAARSLAPDAILNGLQTLRNFTIPEADADMEIGNSMDMVFRYGGLFCVRLDDETDIASVAPWTFRVSETRRQRGGVTILNNVIDSNRRERTMLRVELPRAGNLVIQVFTLDGNLVRVLERNRRGGGTYTYEWDGTNAGNRPVARGMYFIRVVGPDIDEIRKVMVVKE